MEDNNEVTFEATGLDEEFLEDERSVNNNATAYVETKEKMPSPRAERFRGMVRKASAENDRSESVEPSPSNLTKGSEAGHSSMSGDDVQGQTSVEEGETSSEGELDSPQSVKILHRSKEEVESEEQEYQAAKEEFLDQAVSKTFDKLRMLMQEEEIVFSKGG